MADFRNLEVWKLGRALAVAAYRFTEHLPSSEKSGLVSQIQRAAVSIPANISEGAGRGSDAELLRFLRTSIGSLNELETLVLIAGDLKFAGERDTAEMMALIRDQGVKMHNFEARLLVSVNKQRYVREQPATYDGATESNDPQAIV